MQEVIDDLTHQRVMLPPEGLWITIQSICPSFIKKKNQAQKKPKELPTKDDVRLLINYGPVNKKIKFIPIPMTTTDNIFKVLGRWKHIIIFDMYNGFFQNHMDPTAMHWLAIMSPFGGLRIVTGSSQGLLRQSEKFNILLKKGSQRGTSRRHLLPNHR